VAKPSLSSIGPLVRERRGAKGIREAAQEIGISSATLSRVENGRLPDLDTFSKVCRWLKIDPSEILGCQTPAGKEIAQGQKMVFAHLRAEKTQSTEIAQALAEMILAAQSMISETIK
jgi:transcriptional regulator with XRE-family HTH domain